MKQIKEKAKKSCMVSFRQLHSHLKRLSQNDLQGSRTKSGFKCAFATLFGQDIESFTGTMFLNVKQMEKQLDKEDFQEIGSMAAFNVLEMRFQMFITSWVYLNDEYVAMKHIYFIQYTQQAILEFPIKRLSQNDLQGSRTKSGFKRAFATLFGQDIESFTGTMFLNVKQLEKQLDKEDFQEIGSMAAFNVLEMRFQMFITAQHKREYDSWMNERHMQTTEEKIDTSKALDASLVDTESSGTESKEQYTSSRSGNDTHDDVVDIKPIYDEEPMAKPRCDSQVDVNYDLSKPVTTHYFPKERETASTKPHHMIASSNSMISSKNMPRFSSNDMVHNHYLEEAKKKTQEHSRNSEPSLMPSARSQSTANGSKPKPRINNQTSRN
nr:hypothetical protein [Tanacetum cinerariifolium]